MSELTPIQEFVRHRIAGEARGDRSLYLGNDTLTAEATASFARDPRGVHVPVARDAEERIAPSPALKPELIMSPQPIYGVTTGFGDSVIRQISPQKAAALQGNLVVFHLNGIGPTAAPEVVRATLLVRA